MGMLVTGSQAMGGFRFVELRIVIALAALDHDSFTFAEATLAVSRGNGTGTVISLEGKLSP